MTAVVALLLAASHIYQQNFLMKDEDDVGYRPEFIDYMGQEFFADQIHRVQKLKGRKPIEEPGI